MPLSHVLEAEKIHKDFSGVQALRGVDLRVSRGEIHALLGQNGAGKSTLVKILNGVHPAGTFAGTVRLGGAIVRFHSPADALRRGVAYVPQELQVLEHLSVAENIFVGWTSLGRGPVVRFGQLSERAAQVLGRLEVALDPRASVATLSAAQRQLVMVARAIATDPHVLMLDEPTASLSIREASHLFDVLRRLRTAGVTTVFITHRINEAMGLCDHASVLRDGRVVAEFERAEFSQEDIVSAMVGRRLDLGQLHSPRADVGRRALLELRQVRVSNPTAARDLIEDASLEVHHGEVVGLAGLVGSGRTELLGAIYGRLPYTGEILVDGRKVRLRSPADARRAGIAMLTEDRKNEGLLFNFPVGRNITLGNLTTLARYGVVDRPREQEAARSFLKSLSIKATSLSADVSHLSGGNQQKLLLARVLMRKPRLLLLDEPTKGVDIGTKQEIYRLVRELAAQGIGLLVVSSELPELIELCDRCLVLARGLIVDEFHRDQGSEARVLYATAQA